MMAFRKATKKQRKLRMAIDGPTGSGKTYTALEVATGIVGPGGRIAAIDTENRSAELYAHLFDFDTDQLSRHRPEDYRRKIDEAVDGGYDLLIIDSFSHAWAGREGALELVDKASAKNEASGSKANFFAWREVSPEHNKLVDAIIYAPLHVIVTMRSKMAYEIEMVDGKPVPRKIGLQPIQRDGVEYEFDFVGDMNLNHDMVVSKHRFHGLDLDVIRKPTRALGRRLIDWLNAGEEDRTLERKRVIDGLNAVRLELGPVYWEIVGSGWKPKSLEEAKERLADLKVALERMRASAAAPGGLDDEAPLVLDDSTDEHAENVRPLDPVANHGG